MKQHCVEFIKAYTVAHDGDPPAAVDLFAAGAAWARASGPPVAYRRLVHSAYELRPRYLYRDDAVDGWEALYLHPPQSPDALRIAAERVRDHACAYKAPADGLLVKRELIFALAQALGGSITQEPPRWVEPAQHCQNGGDVCLAGNATGLCCPDDSCDIDDGMTERDPRNMQEDWKMIKPISPRDVGASKANEIPAAVFEAFNAEIAIRFAHGIARVEQNTIVERLEQGGMDRNEIFKRGLLNVEEAYRNAGWQVTYEKPGYNESGPAVFEFRSADPSVKAL